jgi:hypothetical protein
VFDCFNDVAGPCFAFGSDHGGALTDSSQRFTEIAASANERNLKFPLIDVEGIIGWGEDFAFVNIVDPDRLQDLALDKVPNASLGHDRDRHRALNFFDHRWVRHTSHAAVAADIGRDALERHDGAGACFFGDASLCEPVRQCV